MTFDEFYRQFEAAFSKLLDYREANPPTGEPPVIADWNALRSIVRAFAEELMLCPDVDSAITRLKQDPAALQGILWLTSELSDDQDIELLQRAYESTPADTPLLPFLPFCSYLIEICDNLQIGPE